mgnify:CR=1 FL=1
MKFLSRWVARLWFRFRHFNTEALQTPGPVLLIPNHVSWLDWLFLYSVLDDDWKFVTSSTTAQASWVHRKMMLNRRTFPVDPSSPYSAKHMANFLAQKGRLVLFAEGRISLSGSLMKLFDGTGFLIHKTGAKVIICYLRNASRVPFVRHIGWTQWFPRVSAHFSSALTAPKMEGVSNAVARQRITTWLRDALLRQQFEGEQKMGPTNVLALIVEAARKQPGKVVLEDVTLTELTFRRFLVAIDVLAQEWLRRWGSSAGVDSNRVGVLLPNVNGTPVTIFSLWSAGFVPTGKMRPSTPMSMARNSQEARKVKELLNRATDIPTYPVDVTFLSSEAAPMRGLVAEVP